MLYAVRAEPLLLPTHHLAGHLVCWPVSRLTLLAAVAPQLAAGALHDLATSTWHLATAVAGIAAVVWRRSSTC